MTNLAKAREMIEAAKQADNGSLAVEPAEDAVRLLLDEADEDEPGLREAAVALIDVWEERGLSAEIVARVKRVADLERDMERLRAKVGLKK